MKHIITAIIVIILSSGTLSAQGLHVAENHTVLFGADTLGAGAKLMWIPNKGAFRAGEVNGAQWDYTNIGLYSVSFGKDNRALSPYSHVSGDNNIAFSSSDFAHAYGKDNIIRDDAFYSYAFGEANLIDQGAAFSHVLGGENKIGQDAAFSHASGLFNTIGQNAVLAHAVGGGNKAKSSFEYIFGRYADTTVVAAGVAGTWAENQQLFALGIGEDDDNRKNALTVLKNGQTTIESTGSHALLAKSTATSGNGVGVWGIADGGTNSIGIYGYASNGSSTNYGVYGEASGSNDFAGYFFGDVHVTEVITQNVPAARLKNIIHTKGSKNLLSKLTQIDIEEYTYKDEYVKKLSLSKGIQRGVIAQQLETIFPDLVKTIHHPDLEDKGESTEYIGVNYIGLIPIMVESIKEQQKIIEQQAAENKSIQERLLRLEGLILQLSEK